MPKCRISCAACRMLIVAPRSSERSRDISMAPISVFVRSTPFKKVLKKLLPDKSAVSKRKELILHELISQAVILD